MGRRGLREHSSMAVPYSSFCDDFYVNMRLGSQLQLPHQRETVLHFFERLQKDFPGMARFRKAENGELSLEEDRNGNSDLWPTLEKTLLPSAHVNPASLDDSLKIHKLMLEMAPYHLGVSPVEVD